MKLLNGKALAAEIREEIKQSVQDLSGRPPSLAVILVGNNPASEIYVRRKRQACEEVGIRSVFHSFDVSVAEAQLLHCVEACNKDPTIDGILVQLPLPSHINDKVVTLTIDPGKDVDGFHPINVGKLLMGEADGFVPCTPLGIKELLQRNGIETAGKHAIIVGRSNIVGKPMAALLMQNAPGANATVTVAHSKTKGLAELCASADIVIAAIGRPNSINEEMVKEGAVVIDVGINRINSPERPSGYQIVGDVDFERVKEKCSFITPVPGGVGPLTIAMLLQNTLTSYRCRDGR